MLRHFQHGTYTVDRQKDFFRDLFRGWFTAIFLDELFLHPHQFVDRFDHVNRNPDRARLIGDRAGDCLADPPGCVSGKLVAAPVLKLLHRFHQAHVALLDQIQKGKTAVRIFFGDGNNETQIGFHHFSFRPQRLPQPLFQGPILLGIGVERKPKTSFQFAHLACKEGALLSIAGVLAKLALEVKRCGVSLIR